MYFITIYKYIFVCCVSVFREHGMVSVGFCVVNTLKRAYPPEDATHIALSNFLLLIFFYLVL